MKMKFLCVSTNTRDISDLVAEEGRRVEELSAAGTLTHIWLKADFSGAVIVLDCADEGDARAALDSLPIAKSGATTFVITALADMA